MLMADSSAWIITDGKAGDEQQCLGIVQALGIPYKVIQVQPRKPYVWFMPLGPIDPRDRPSLPGSILAPPFADIIIGSGRRAVPYLRVLKNASDGHCFTVFLKDPRTGLRSADFIWVPEHDTLRGKNVFVTLTSPHVFGHERCKPDDRLMSLQCPKVAVLLGGNSSIYKFTENDCVKLAKDLKEIAVSGASLMVTASRRTPGKLKEFIYAIIKQYNGFFWDGTGPNPLNSMLSSADHLVVTADSVNMVGEAVSTGKPVYFFSPTGGSSKTDYFLSALQQLGAIRPLTGDLISWSYQPVNSTPIIAAAIKKKYLEFRKDIP